MKKHSILYVRKFEYPRENFLKSFANSSLFKVVNTAENVEGALELIKTQKPSIVVTGTMFEDGTAYDIIKGIESILNYRPYIAIVTALPLNDVCAYYRRGADHIFCDMAFNEEILTTYFEKLATAV